MLLRRVVTGLILLGIAAAAVYYTRSPHDRYALQLRIFDPAAASRSTAITCCASIPHSTTRPPLTWRSAWSRVS